MNLSGLSYEQKERLLHSLMMKRHAKHRRELQLQNPHRIHLYKLELPPAADQADLMERLVTARVRVPLMDKYGAKWPDSAEWQEFLQKKQDPRTITRMFYSQCLERP